MHRIKPIADFFGLTTARLALCSVLLIVPLGSYSEEIDAGDPEIAKVLAEYEACLGAAVAKAETMKTAMLREKVFNGKTKGCKRKLAADTGAIRERALHENLKSETAMLRAEQEAAELRIAKMTDNLIANAKKDLGF